MITCTGIGIVPAGRYTAFARRPFNAEGTGSALATITALAALCLVLPTFTSSRAGPDSPALS